MTETTEAAPAEAKPPRLSPLEALAKRPTAITDVVYGADHPSKSPRKAPPQKRQAAAGSLVGDLLDPNTRTALNGLKWRLERAQTRMNARRKKS